MVKVAAHLLRDLLGRGDRVPQVLSEFNPRIAEAFVVVVMMTVRAIAAARSSSLSHYISYTVGSNGSHTVDGSICLWLFHTAETVSTRETITDLLTNLLAPLQGQGLVRE